MSDVYYEPGKFGLSIIGEVEFRLSYEFDMFVVWKRLADGAIFYANDSGCSCPSPFERYTSVDNLTRAQDAAVCRKQRR